MSLPVEQFLNGRVTLYCGDCLDVLKTLPDNSVDSVVCDPPYHLTSIIKRFGKEGSAPAKAKQTGAFARASRGFMGKQWDGGDIAFRPELWAEVLRVLKPGGHVVAFSGTRTYHRMTCAIEDAGFEVRDQIGWAYGSGFPKSHDVSKALDKRLGHWRGRAGAVKEETVGQVAKGTEYERTDKGEPVTDEARKWEGWGTALKPAWEPICVARKQLDGTVADNVLKHGTGALNIDGCRISTGEHISNHGHSAESGKSKSAFGDFAGIAPFQSEGQKLGRWPANILHDGSDEVLAAFPDAPGQQRYVGPEHGDRLSRGVYGDFGPRPENQHRGDSGSAARFFYSAKADATDRIASKHPTVKPVDLMQWLCRLVTPPKGIILDPFAGTGTTGEAAWREGFNAVLIERDAEYQNDIRRRMSLCMAGPDEKAIAIVKEKQKDKPVDAGPLFGGCETVAGGADRFTATSPIRTNNWPDRTQKVSDAS